MKSLIWDLLLLLLFMYYQSKLRVGVWEGDSRTGVLAGQQVR